MQDFNYNAIHTKASQGLLKVQQIFRSKQRPELLHKKGILKTFSNSQKSTCVVVSLLTKTHLQFN